MNYKDIFAKSHEVEFLGVTPRKMLFKDIEHEKRYYVFGLQMKAKDCYHKALAYLLTLDENIYSNEERLKACFDLENDSIHPEVLNEPWITGTDRRILTLAFNLWNGNTPADVSDVFSCSEDLPCLLEAVRIRFA